MPRLWRRPAGRPWRCLYRTAPTPEPRSFIGDGKVQELKGIIEMNDCDLAVFDNELSPSQMRVLSEELGVKVLDRSGLILDIFAQRAQTREGQLSGGAGAVQISAAAPDGHVDASLCQTARRRVAHRHTRPRRDAA